MIEDDKKGGLQRIIMGLRGESPNQSEKVVPLPEGGSLDASCFAEFWTYLYE